MRVLVTSAYGSRGDVLPFIGIAAALRARGHEVYFFCSETQFPFVSRLEEAQDLQIIEIKAEFDGPNKWAPGTSASLAERAKSMAKKWLSTLKVLYFALDEKIDPGRTVIVSHPLNFAARLLQEKRILPNVTAILQPWLLRSVYRTPISEPRLILDCYPQCLKSAIYWSMDKMTDSALVPEINDFARELGLAPVSRIFHKWFLSPDRVVALFPCWYADFQPDWPPQLRFTQFPLWKGTIGILPRKLMDFISGGNTSPIVITAGTANPFCQGKQYFEVLAQACADLKERSIILTNVPEWIPECLPEDCIHFDFAPLSILLAHSRAIIHHGGIGTAAEAMRAGVPSLVIPTQFDQFDNADLLSQLGVATSLPGKQVCRKSAKLALRRLLYSEEIEENCHKIARSIALKSPTDEVCEEIEGMLPPGIAFDGIDLSTMSAKKAWLQKCPHETYSADVIPTKLQLEFAHQRAEEFETSARALPPVVEVAVDTGSPSSVGKNGMKDTQLSSWRDPLQSNRGLI